MTRFIAPKLIALTATLLSLAGVASASPLPQDGALHLTVGSAAPSDTTVIARRGRGADDGAGHNRRGRGADDPAGHAALQWKLELPTDFDRRGRGKDDPAGHAALDSQPLDGTVIARRGRGADDGAGHARRGRGKDDPVGHG